jgi:hypothetical protein
MYLRSHPNHLNCRDNTLRLLIGFLIILLTPVVMEAKVAAVSGVIFTVSSEHVQTLWPNARVTLKNLDTNDEYTTVSNVGGVLVCRSVIGRM